MGACKRTRSTRGMARAAFAVKRGWQSSPDLCTGWREGNQERDAMDTDIIIHAHVIECRECGELNVTEDHFNGDGRCIHNPPWERDTLANLGLSESDFR